MFTTMCVSNNQVRNNRHEHGVRHNCSLLHCPASGLTIVYLTDEKIAEILLTAVGMLLYLKILMKRNNNQLDPAKDYIFLIYCVVNAKIDNI